MRMYDLIQRKRDGGALTEEEIRWFVEGYTKGTIPDYQASALCMAIYFRGMTIEETSYLTFAIRDSGEKLHFEGIEGVRVDKHSTGGVGDKTSLVVAPLVATFGVKVAKISGRGLGHTGGTIDKLESIKGFRTDIPTEEMIRIVNRTGLAIVGQNAELAPADKKLYALRDVTATVDSMPLIVSSIMGKKLAADDDCIVLDVKTGSGSFMKTLEDSRKLADMMVEIGKRAGKKMLALITDMDRPLGYAIGNALEVQEAIETLNGNGPEDLTKICVCLAAHMIALAGCCGGDYGICERKVWELIRSGEAIQTLADMVYEQGGESMWIHHPEFFPRAKRSRIVRAPESGFITGVDTEGYGVTSLLLGAGRNTKEDRIDPAAGILLQAKTGDRVDRGEPLAFLFADSEERLDAAEAKFLQSTRIGDAAPEKRPLILDIVR